MTTGKYENYSLESLNEMFDKIDGKKYPEEAGEIRERMLTLEKEENLADESDYISALVVDFFIVCVIYLVIVFAIGTETVSEFNKSLGGFRHLFWVGFLYSVFYLLNSFLYIKYGQSIGKIIKKIKYVDENNEVPEIYRRYYFRFVIIQLIQVVTLTLLDKYITIGGEKYVEHIKKRKLVYVTRVNGNNDPTKYLNIP